jgi:hypothetical protein
MQDILARNLISGKFPLRKRVVTSRQDLGDSFKPGAKEDKAVAYGVVMPMRL